MRKKSRLFTVLFFLGSTAPIFAQQHVEHSAFEAEIFGLLELPFLIIAIVFSFLTASNLKGGKFGAGMSLLAWGFLVMAVGHIHMQLDHLFNFHLFKELLGEVGGKYAWFVALIITWGLSALGFYKIYKASKV